MLTEPLYRRWHLHWGATLAEARAATPGDALVPISHFTATRAITIEARPSEVWPWLAQAGYGRASFYSYDLLDNLGRPSATAIMPQRQRAHVGDVAAPMATPSTSFLVADAEPDARLVWA
jgi:hypothetical protein